MRIAIAIVNYNGASYLGDCLESLKTLTRPPESIFLFDNASGDASLDVVRRVSPETRIIASPQNVGFTGGVNACMRACLDEGFDVLLLLNPDTVVDAKLTERLAEAATRHRGAILVPAICFAGTREPVLNTYVGEVSWWRGQSNARLRGRVPGASIGEERVGTASGCCLWIPAEVVRTVGLFDDSYFLYFEDLDYLERAGLASIEAWHVPAGVVWHLESAATGGRGTPLATYYFARNRHYFVRKFRKGQPSHLAFLAYELADVTVRVIGFCLTGRLDVARALLRGVRDGWTGRMGPDRTVHAAAPAIPSDL